MHLSQVVDKACAKDTAWLDGPGQNASTDEVGPNGSGNAWRELMTVVVLVLTLFAFATPFRSHVADAPLVNPVPKTWTSSVTP